MFYIFLYIYFKKYFYVTKSKSQSFMQQLNVTFYFPLFINTVLESFWMNFSDKYR